MKHKFHAIGAIPKSNIKTIVRDQIDTTNMQLHDSSRSCLGTDTSMKSGDVKLI